MDFARTTALTLLGAIITVACGEDKPPPEPIIRPVRYVQVFVTGSARERSFSGTSQAALQSKLSFKVAGTVNRIPVKVGDVVRAGALIARLDDIDYRLQVQEAEAALASLKAQARSADANYSRVRALYENRNASANDLDAARAASESATAQVVRAEKAVELAKSQLGYATLRSPANGSIAAVPVEENENVSPGRTVALLTSGSRLEVEVAMPEILIAQIREGDTASVLFDAIQEKVFSATVTEVAVSATGMATTFPVTVRLDETDESFRPGLAAEVRFVFDSRDSRNRVVVPTVSVGEDREGRYVFVLDRQEKGYAISRRREVTIGELTQEGLEILEGLSDGELVVTAGVTRIADGQRVRVPSQ